LPSKTIDPTIERAITTEWATAPAAGAALLGPVRQGSQWLIAARAPISAAAAGDTPRLIGWSVASAELDRLLISSRLGRVTDAGYDFALVQPEGANARTFLSSRSAPLDDAVASTIRPPRGFAFGATRANLQIEIRPRDGWYPASELATDIGVLAVVAWMITFAVHELTYRSRRLKAALAASRHQVREVNQRLTREIEQRQSLQKSFDHARYHDAFTGLPNRRYFMDQLDRALREVRTRRRRRVAVILIDIDRFRLINDTLGHTAGDELMVQTARRFQKATAELECVLSRWGGDQFAVLVLDMESADAAVALADKLHESLSEPFDLRRHRLGVTARMGVTCVEAGPQRAEDVVREADVALSVAKRRENAKSIAYVPAMGGQAASLVSLEADLHVALERNELKLLFQPIVDLRGRRMIGAEVLLRWRHPVEGLLRPERFLSIAEEAGLMAPITRWTIPRVCKLVSEWRRRVPQDTPFFMSVNLSAASLRDPGLSACVARALKDTQTPAQYLKFELTEGGLISNVGGARETLEQLHNMGIQLMLDDFGTGYSSLNYLQLFPFDYVKIDRPLLDRTGSEQSSGSLTSAMVQMASSLGLTPIAEVVETQAAAQALQQMGCNFGQGYFFCAPVEAEEALECLRNGDLQGQGEREAAASDWNDDSPTLMLPVVVDPEDDTEP
jgi:diguanylate cyclase (GGDEF)-like protein